MTILVAQEWCGSDKYNSISCVFVSFAQTVDFLNPHRNNKYDLPVVVSDKSAPDKKYPTKNTTNTTNEEQSNRSNVFRTAGGSQDSS